MAINEIRENDIGVVFEVEIRDNSNTVVDISTSETGTRNFIFTKPNDTSITRSGTFTNTGTDGLLRYVSVDGDLTPKGIWHYQIDLLKADGHWRSDTVKFRVYRNL